MYYLRQHVLDPLAREYNRYIDGYTLSSLLQVKGGRQAGNDYISKVFRSKYIQIQQKYDSSVDSVKNPTFASFLEDNIVKLVAGNAIERLIAAYQAYPVLKASLIYPGTLSHTFTEITNQGLFSGLLKGTLVAAAQMSLVLYPSVYMANKSDNKYLTFLASYTALDTLLYPLDTIKNILYAETHTNQKLRNVLNTVPLGGMFRGIWFKLLFNVPYLSSLYFTTQGDFGTWAAVSWLATAALYPLNTAKVRAQLLASGFGFGNQNGYSFKLELYRGLAPFLLVNLFLGWTLRPLFSEQKLASIKKSVQDEKWAELRKH